MDIFQSYYTLDKGWLDPLPNLDSPQTLVLGFGHADFLTQLEPFNEINRQYPNSVIAGCSTPAGILDNRVEKEGLVISITRFCDTRLSYVAIEKRYEESSAELGNRIALEVKEDSLVAVLTFADGVAVNGSQYMEGIGDIVAGTRAETRASKVVVTGGLAAESGEQTQSWVLKQGRPKKATASAIGF
ncbi:MAG: FIST N-terminal domain-containing protein, partial [Thiotrichaceae bacterium]